MPQFIWKGTRVKQVEQQQQQKKASTDEMSKIWDPESKKCNQQKAGNGKSKEKKLKRKTKLRTNQCGSQRSVSREDKQVRGAQETQKNQQTPKVQFVRKLIFSPDPLSNLEW